MLCDEIYTFIKLCIAREIIKFQSHRCHKLHDLSSKILGVKREEDAGKFLTWGMETQQSKNSHSLGYTLQKVQLLPSTILERAPRRSRLDVTMYSGKPLQCTFT